MPELQFQKSADAWGLTANNMTFSGVFDKTRINKELGRQFIYKIVTIVLWAVVGFALLAFAWQIFTVSKSQNFSALLGHNFYNLVISIGILAGLYQWARVKQKGLLASTQSLKPNQVLDIYSIFTDSSKEIWNKSLSIAEKNGRQTVTCLDIFSSLLKHPAMDIVFLRLGISPQDLSASLESKQPIGETDELEKLPFIAANKTLELQQTSVDPVIILDALIEILPHNHIVQNLFFNLNISPEDISLMAAWMTNLSSLSTSWQVFKKLARFKPDNEINKGLTSIPTPYLDKFSSDITSQAKHGALTLTTGRSEDLQSLLKLLGERSGNVVIKGATGTGRTTLINELAFKMAAEEVPLALEDQRLVKLELSGIIGNTGRAETVLTGCLDEAGRSGNIVLVMEEVQNLAKAKSSQGLSLLELVTDYLSQSNLRVLATTTIEDYTSALQKTSNFDQVFQQYELKELTHKQLLVACCVRASLLEGQYHCFFQLKAVEQAFELSDKYVQNLSQPQKTIAVLVEAASQAKSAGGKKYQIITAERIAKIVSTKTHIPTATFSDNEAKKLLKLETELAKNVIGQKAAVAAVSEGLRRARSGLSSGNRPLASFLFLGPTGVGKTELAKTLAAVYFGKPEYLLRLDMSEYSGPDALTKLLGNPNGGSDSPIISHIKNYPFCLLLLDEFEKAAPEVHNIFLQILDDGRLTSAAGETLKLANTMVIATSNAGTLEIQEGIKSGKSPEEIKTILMKTTLQQTFRPELLNRFDGVIVFSPLSRDEVKQVTDLQLEYLRSQLLEKGIKIKFSAAVITQISQNAFDPLLGARPIRRYIQDNVEGFISKLILSQQLARGSNVTVDFKDGNYLIK